MSNTLHIAILTNEGPASATVLQLTGPLDANTHNDLETAANEAIENGAQNIILEMSNVSYMSSAGLRAIHAITKKLNNDDNENAIKSDNLRIASPSDEVRKIFKTLGFDAYIDIIDDLDSAIASF